eukprot:5693616-Amphidinium_carterae.4
MMIMFKLHVLAVQRTSKDPLNVGKKQTPRQTRSKSQLQTVAACPALAHCIEQIVDCMQVGSG